MENLNFDTHENVKKLISVGLTEEQAEMHTKIIGVLIDEQLINRHAHDKLQVSIEELRRDMEKGHDKLQVSIEELRRETKTSIEELRQETKLSIAELRRDMEKGHDKLQLSIEELRQETKLSHIQLKHDLTLRLGSIIVSSMVIMFGMLKLFL